MEKFLIAFFSYIFAYLLVDGVKTFIAKKKIQQMMKKQSIEAEKQMDEFWDNYDKGE